MAEIQVKNSALKLVFVVHLILIAWGSQGWWSSDSYLFTNLVFFSILLWGMHAHDNPEPMQLAVAVNSICIVLDVVLLSIRYPTSARGISDRFSAWMAVLNLIIRPFTTIVLWRLMQERNGTGSGSSYEDIDRPVIHSVPPQMDVSNQGKA